MSTGKYQSLRGRSSYRGRNRRGNFGRQQYFNRRDKQAILEGPSENEVGITQYLSTEEGFSGIIKARFSDFHVNEINLNGEQAKLTDTKVPDFKVDGKNDEKNAEVDQSTTPSEHIPQEMWDNIKQMVETEMADADPKLIELDVTSITKEERSQIHECVKRAFGQKIVASTKTFDDKKKVIQFKKYDRDVPRDERMNWPKDLGEYVYFLVYKEAIDTIHACFKISDCLNMKANLFTYAGVKDRRAKTTQWFCVKKIDPRKLVTKTKWLNNIHVGNVTFKDQPLKLGQLQGNRFRIALRNVTAEDVLINGAMDYLKTNGFINYYGLQRFGSDRDVPTFSIGKELLRGNWKAACELILKPKRVDTDPEVTMAKTVYKDTGSAEKAFGLIKRRNNCIESKLLQGLAKNHANDYVNALECIPRNIRLLYLHSFQSLIWNQIVSRRIKEFGPKPIVGDLVLVSGDTAEYIEEEIIENQNEPEPEDENDTIVRQEVKSLTEEDLGNYSIYDIVLPLPGYDIKYPDNVVKDWYKELLESHNLSLEMPKQKVKTYNLSGAYRKILGQVKDFSWKIVKYNNPDDVLIRSDHEELRGLMELQTNEDGKYKAIVVDFCLDSSCYATMVLREILKTDTSARAHAKLNDYHEKVVPVKTADEGQVPEVNSLLKDADKFEEFKKNLFTDPAQGVKRKADEETDVGNKKVATEEK